MFIDAVPLIPTLLSFFSLSLSLSFYCYLSLRRLRSRVVFVLIYSGRATTKMFYYQLMVPVSSDLGPADKDHLPVGINP